MATFLVNLDLPLVVRRPPASGGPQRLAELGWPTWPPPAPLSLRRGRKGAGQLPDTRPGAAHRAGAGGP